MPRAPLIWFAEEGSIAVNGRLYSTQVTNIEIRGGAREVDQIRTFGAGTFQAQRPQQQFETAITAIVSGVDFSSFVFGLGSTTGKGRLVSGDGMRSSINVVYTYADPTDVNGASLRFRFASGFGIESTLTQTAEGELQETFTFKSTPSNTFREFSSGPASTLVTPAL